MAVNLNSLLASPPVLPGISSDTTALITGGTGAIGGRVAEVMARMGVRVAIVGRSPEHVEKEAARFSEDGGDVIGIAADVASAEDVARVRSTVIDAWGHLDVVVHSAAVIDSGTPVADLDSAEVDAVLATNVAGSLNVAREAAIAMRPQGSGAIVNVSSIAAHRCMDGRALYSMTKAAMSHLTRQLACELGPHGIRVNAVSPGQTPTDMRGYDEDPGTPPSFKGDPVVSGLDRIPLGRVGRLDDFVGPILFLVSDLASYVTGVDLLVEGGAVHPR